MGFIYKILCQHVRGCQRLSTESRLGLQAQVELSWKRMAQDDRMHKSRPHGDEIALSFRERAHVVEGIR